VLHAARSALLADGGHVVAPCTHANTCPLAASGKADQPWCHFSVRLPRSRLHRAAKGAALGYEDEPFSYLVMSRTPLPHRGARIIAPPCGCKHQPEVVLCSAAGVERRKFSKRDREGYAAARRAKWGGWWE
jgi:ribosomal protein RSM22 (predicted rRNA methylase)